MRTESKPARVVAAMVSGGYYLIQKLWAEGFKWGLLRSRRAPVPAVSVGNLLMGGSGKTPFAIFLAELLQERGFKPAVVSRGYRGANRKPYLVVGDGRCSVPLVAPAVSGDEPFLMASRLPGIPVLIGRKRIDAVQAASGLFGSNVVVLDDGFQHLALERDVDIVLLTGREDCMFPSGALREPISALIRADMVVLMGNQANIPRSAERFVGNLPVFRCRQVAVSIRNNAGTAPLSPSDYTDREVALLSGIANPDRFRLTAEGLGWEVSRHIIYPDHHVFSESDLKAALDLCRSTPIIVTEKDWVKLPEWFRNQDRVSALRIGIVMEDVEGFWQTLSRFLSPPDWNP